MEHSALSIFPKDAANRRKVFLFRLPECSLSYAKIMQASATARKEKRSFTVLDTAEPKLILCKDNARRVQQQEGGNEVLPFLILPSAAYLMQR